MAPQAECNFIFSSLFVPTVNTDVSEMRLRLNFIFKNSNRDSHLLRPYCVPPSLGNNYFTGLSGEGGGIINNNLNGALHGVFLFFIRNDPQHTGGNECFKSRRPRGLRKLCVLD